MLSNNKAVLMAALLFLMFLFLKFSAINSSWQNSWKEKTKEVSNFNEENMDDL